MLFHLFRIYSSICLYSIFHIPIHLYLYLFLCIRIFCSIIVEDREMLYQHYRFVHNEPFETLRLPPQLPGIVSAAPYMFLFVFLGFSAS